MIPVVGAEEGGAPAPEAPDGGAVPDPVIVAVEGGAPAPEAPGRGAVPDPVIPVAGPEEGGALAAPLTPEEATGEDKKDEDHKWDWCIKDGVTEGQWDNCLGWQTVAQPIIGELTSAAANARIPYRVRVSLLTEVGNPMINDHVPEVRDSREASQDQAEDATEDKDARKSQVNPIVSTGFSFGAMDSDYEHDSGFYKGEAI